MRGGARFDVDLLTKRLPVPRPAWPICPRMQKLLGFVGMTVGGFAGYWLGSFVGLGTALFASAIGSGVGLYFGRRLLDDLIG